MQLLLLHLRRFLFYFSLWFTVRVIGYVLLNTRDEVMTALYQPITYVIGLVLAGALTVYQFSIDRKQRKDS